MLCSSYLKKIYILRIPCASGSLTHFSVSILTGARYALLWSRRRDPASMDSKLAPCSEFLGMPCTLPPPLTPHFQNTNIILYFSRVISAFSYVSLPIHKYNTFPPRATTVPSSQVPTLLEVRPVLPSSLCAAAGLPFFSFFFSGYLKRS